MNLKNKTIEDWLKYPPIKAFPQGERKDYFSQYATLKKKLHSLHNQVVNGANLVNKDLLLNDHGPDHIKTVIKRASLMLDNSPCELTAKEVYLLLAAIQIHDVGNILGRYQHELRIEEVLKECLQLVGEDRIEQITIRDIAEAHGGMDANQNKDKIEKLLHEDHILSEKIRPRLLASILRFADELADDKTRSSIKLFTLGNLPKGSEIFHIYAFCLDSVLVSIEQKTIELKFKIPTEYVKRKFGKMLKDGSVTDVYLIDEIYDRAMKMHYERIYTMRFMRDVIKLEKILVIIDFYHSYDSNEGKQSKKGKKVKIDKLPSPITFELKETGYPSSQADIFSLCSNLMVNDKKVDGLYVLKQLK